MSAADPRPRQIISDGSFRVASVQFLPGGDKLLVNTDKDVIEIRHMDKHEIFFKESSTAIAERITVNRIKQVAALLPKGRALHVEIKEAWEWPANSRRTERVSIEYHFTVLDN